MEHVKLKTQLIEIEPAENGRITDIIRENKTRADDSHVKYENGIRYSADVKETPCPAAKYAFRGTTEAFISLPEEPGA